MSRRKFRSVRNFLALEKALNAGEKDTPHRKEILRDIREYEKTVKQIKKRGKK